MMKSVPALRYVLARSFVFALFLALAAGFTQGRAQVFSAEVYYQQCLRFEAGGDLETARQSCLNALELEPEQLGASLALARIELALGNIGAAESRLAQMRNRLDTAEYQVLLAEVALASERYAEAESRISSARSRLGETFDSQLDGRIHFIAGRIAEAGGDYGMAIARYRNAVAADSLNFGFREALARLLFRLGEREAAEAELETYEQLSGDSRNPLLLSLLGRINWSQGELEQAASRLETAVALRGSGEGEALARDLQALALIYYGQGDLRAGRLALSSASQRGTLLMELLNQSLPWLLAFIVLLALHLLGESRVPSSQVSSLPEGPALWSLADIYRSLFLSLLVALAAAVLYSVLLHGNILAAFTPLQSGDVRAVYFAVLATSLTAFAAWRLRENGWDAGEKLLGDSSQVSLGLLAGLGMLVLTLGFLHYAPRLGGFGWGSYYLDLIHLQPTVVAAALLVPLSELFFTAFVLPPLVKRYQRRMALAISALLFALLLASPLVLLLLLGWVLAEVFMRSDSGLVALIAKLVLNVGLVLGVAFLPFVRGLFF